MLVFSGHACSASAHSIERELEAWAKQSRKKENQGIEV